MNNVVPTERRKSPRAGFASLDHEDLPDRWALDPLSARASRSKSGDLDRERDLLRFKRLHLCARRLKRLRARYGELATMQSDWQECARLHQQLRNEIAANNVALVYSLYKKNATRNVDHDELLSAGMMALTLAIDSFNPWHGTRFSTYAYYAIVRAFWRCSAVETRRRLHERLCSNSDLEKVKQIEPRRSEESIIGARRLSLILADNRADLTAVEKAVLDQRFPLDADMPVRTLCDLGREMSLTHERVRQIQNSAIKKLRMTLDADMGFR